MILGLVAEAVESGAGHGRACEAFGLDPRTAQRWRRQGIGEDQRTGPSSAPGNKLTDEERAHILEVVNGPDFRDLTPKQIVPALADAGRYLASESTIYRLLRERQMLEHRGRARPAQHARPEALVASGPNQVWSWDITYLKAPVRGQFLFLYLVTDVFSRKIVGCVVHDTESADHAAALIVATCVHENVPRGQLTIHSDNGRPMKGATMLATLQELGVVPSFSRPHVSDDNPYSEALFRTLKYRPEYPSGCFASLDAAREWVGLFVAWYNHSHYHSAIAFVTPACRHAGEDQAILAARREVYHAAHSQHPERWSRQPRAWTRTDSVSLNPRGKAADEAVA